MTIISALRRSNLVSFFSVNPSQQRNTAMTTKYITSLAAFAALITFVNPNTASAAPAVGCDECPQLLTPIARKQCLESCGTAKPATPAGPKLKKCAKTGEMIPADTWNAESCKKDPIVKDRDNDGIPDNVDECPDNAGSAPHGCPDTDEDGIHDGFDMCVTEPEDKDGFEDEDGCPEEGPDLCRNDDGQVLNTPPSPCELAIFIDETHTALYGTPDSQDENGNVVPGQPGLVKLTSSLGNGYWWLWPHIVTWLMLLAGFTTTIMVIIRRTETPEEKKARIEKATAKKLAKKAGDQRRASNTLNSNPVRTADKPQAAPASTTVHVRSPAAPPNPRPASAEESLEELLQDSPSQPH